MMNSLTNLSKIEFEVEFEVEFEFVFSLVVALNAFHDRKDGVKKLSLKSLCCCKCALEFK